MLNRLSKFLKSRWFSYSVVVALIVLLVSFLVPQYEEFQAKAREKEVLSLLNAAGAAFKAVQGEYENSPGPATWEEVGFNPAGQLHYRIYINAEEIEPRVRSKIPMEYIPYMKHGDFQILAAGAPRAGKLEFWILRSNKGIEKLPFSLSGKEYSWESMRYVYDEN